MIRRAAAAAACVVLTGVYLTRALEAEPRPIRESLASIPLQVAGWSGQVEPPFAPAIVAELGVDEYITRLYSRADGLALGVYIGYHASQRQGDTMHSPLNCLPGAGWLPVERGRARLRVAIAPGGPRREIEVNRFVIQKGLDRQVVYYWYQSRERVVASEYWGKVYTVVDAIRHNRTDGALVRITVPVGQGSTARTEAEAAGASFIEGLFPLLSRHLPA